MREKKKQHENQKKVVTEVQPHRKSMNTFAAFLEKEPSLKIGKFKKTTFANFMDNEPGN